jgi:hypothetical protein
MLFECLSYMSYMYMRKHHKRTVCQGEQPRMERYLAIDDKGGEIYQMQRTEAWFRGKLSDAEDKGMVLGGADLLDAEDKGIVPGGA